MTAHGASQAEWSHFADTLGLREDLLPVVSDPAATISPESKMKDKGKTPSRFNKAGFVVGIPAWTAHKASERDIERWSVDERLGICVQTRTVRAIDIDIDDPALAGEVRAAVLAVLPGAAVRFRAGTGKCLIPVRVPGDFGKRSFGVRGGARVELLATGQQFVAVGTHPKGMRYEWADADGVLGLPAAIPELDMAALDYLWQSLVEEFGVAGTEQRVGMAVALHKPRLLADADDAAVPWLFDQGLVMGETTKGLEVECPNVLAHSSDTGYAMYFPRGVGGHDEPGFKCLHDHCSHISGRLFLELIGYDKPADDFDVIDEGGAGGPGDAPALPRFARDRAGRILATLPNLLAALPRPDLTGMHVAYDSFKVDVMVGDAGGAGDAGGTWRRLTDVDYVALRTTLERRGFLPIGAEMIRHAVMLHARDHTFDSAIQWANGLRWDGVSRCETFLSDYFGMPDTPYHRAVALYLWTALAGRCLVAGIKADMVPVFIGAQGAGKTTAVAVLAPEPDAFVEVDLTRKDDDISRMLQGRLVGEIAELKGLQGREAESTKAFISRTHEEWVEKWETRPRKVGRRLLMIGTGNRREILADDTGERRWLPVTVGRIDVAGVGAVRNQLWAEALVLFRTDGIAWQDAQRLALAEHDSYKITDPWDEPLQVWLGHPDLDGVPPKDREFTIYEALRGAIIAPIERQGLREQRRLGAILRRLGYEDVRVHHNGVRRWVWRKAFAP